MNELKIQNEREKMKHEQREITKIYFYFFMNGIFLS